jgi:ribosomal protein S18 acetylase RimI-like enzyme
MATLPEVRGSGAGRALVERACAEAEQRGATFLWFDARRVAFGFYERLGFYYLSEAFDIAPIGEHRVMGAMLPM